MANGLGKSWSKETNEQTIGTIQVKDDEALVWGNNNGNEDTEQIYDIKEV